MVFAVAASSNDKDAGGVVKLYDARNYGGGPFTTFLIDKQKIDALCTTDSEGAALADRCYRSKWLGAAFSPDGEACVAPSLSPPLTL